MAKRRALISVSDKTGIVDFCRALVKLDFEIISTGGTLKALTEAGIAARQVSEITSMPEILDGRVKTLHPTVFGGLLARRNMTADMETIGAYGIDPIDIVAVNLYPFAQTVANPKSSDEEIIENIDIGGPSLLRAAAKNHTDVYVVVDPVDYFAILSALESGRPADYLALRRNLARKVYAHTSAYDKLIAEYFSRQTGPGEGTTADVHGLPQEESALPQALHLNWPIVQALRYGENPHQQAAFYRDPDCPAPSLAHCKQLQGKELSYNNLLDADTALEMIRELADEEACVILKHLNPCGAARGKSALAAYQRALSCDPTSAFGGIVGLTRTIDGSLAEEIGKTFMEVIVAPDFTPEAQEIFAERKNLRLLASGPLHPRLKRLSHKSVYGGMLVQELDVAEADRGTMQVVTKTQPTPADWEAMLFAWKICKWVKSNAIVYANADRILGVGAGQMSRIDSANFGLQKAGGKTPGAAMASDAFFPFRDVVEIAAEAGVRAIIQPGGSIRDAESIQAADEHGIAMVFAGLRHFRH